MSIETEFVRGETDVGLPQLNPNRLTDNRWTVVLRNQAAHFLQTTYEAYPILDE